jgi:hypothetical protein
MINNKCDYSSGAWCAVKIAFFAPTGFSSNTRYKQRYELTKTTTATTTTTTTTTTNLRLGVSVRAIKLRNDGERSYNSQYTN